MVRSGAKSQLSSDRKDAAAMPSAKQINYPGKMGFEDVMGIAVGGTLAALMIILIGIYLFKKRANIFSYKGAHGTHGRALRMRKIER